MSFTSQNADEWHAAYKRANPTEWVDGTGQIQWKGTEVCIDILCPCGHQGHHDGEFLYRWRCSECKKVYTLDPVIRLVETSEDDAELLGCIQNEQVEDDT